jgi:magnesium-transporting ATPase (P-type)
MAHKSSERDNINKDVLSRPWSLSEKEIADIFNIDPEYGLNFRRVEKHRQKYGKNMLQKVARRSAMAIFTDQFKSLIIGLLAAAALVSFLVGQAVEGIAVLAAIFLNTLIGFFHRIQGCSIHGCAAPDEPYRNPGFAERQGENHSCHGHRSRRRSGF